MGLINSLGQTRRGFHNSYFPTLRVKKTLRNSLQAREIESLGEKFFRLAELCREYNFIYDLCHEHYA